MGPKCPVRGKERVGEGEEAAGSEKAKTVRERQRYEEDGRSMEETNKEG